MRPVYFILFLLIIPYKSLFAQQGTIPVFYAKDSSSIIKLDNDYKTVFVFSYPKEVSVKSTIELELTFAGATMIVPSVSEKATDGTSGRTTVFGELPSILFSKQHEGYLKFGKALLSALDTVNSDSMITVSTKAKVDTKIGGPLHLDFKNWPGIYQSFWEEVEYYWLLDKQERLEDTIKILTADNDRGKALLVASTEFVEATTKQKEESEKELNKKYGQHSNIYESLKKIYTRLDQSFEQTKSGKVLSEDEKKQIAFLTADVSKLKKELKEKPDGVYALETFERVTKFQNQYNIAKKQYDAAAEESQQREAVLILYKNKLVDLSKKIKVLKKLLKL